MIEKCYLTIDVEDWFQTENLKAVMDGTWDKQEIRVENSVRKILALLKKHNVKATFFVLGWIAERCPDVIREIANDGHEIASHGYSHKLIYEMGPEAFEQDIKKSVELLESITGKSPVGYRAPSFSITDWAVEILGNEGFEYDSSYFDFEQHDRYGKLDKPAVKNGDEYIYENGLQEYKIPLVTILGKKLPIAGGGYFRLIPYPIYRLLLKKTVKQNGGCVFYLHPWEVDYEQPKVKSGVKWSYRFRHYVGQKRTLKRLEKLICDFDFNAVKSKDTINI